MLKFPGVFFIMVKLPTYSKSPLAIDQQIQLLVDRGLKIENREFAADALANVSYYRLSAYAYPFRSRQTPDRFVDGVSFETVWQYYRFDRRLKGVVLDAIERVEISVRSKLVNVFTAQYGPFGYRHTANFAAPVDVQRFAATLGFIDRETQKSNEEFVAHFRATYDTTQGLPLWMATEVMTFGNLLTIFRLLKKKDKKAIARDYGISAAVLESWLTVLNYIRNVCAHHGRLWNRHLPICPDLPDKDARWHDPAMPVNPNRIYSVLTLLHYLLTTIAPKSEWKTRFLALLEEFPDIHRMSMALPQDFEFSPLWA